MFRRPALLFCLMPALFLFAGQAESQPATQPQAGSQSAPNVEQAKPIDPARVASTNPLHVELRPPPADSPGNHGRHVLRFSNPGGKPVTIYRPLDGAMWGWYRPHYRFEVTNAQGVDIPLSGRCGVSGLWHQSTWPASFEVRLMPGEALEMPVYIPQVVHAEAGDYTVRFSYILPPGTTHADERSPLSQPPSNAPRLPIPEHAWFGTAKAKPITVTVPER
ncbi:MAG: hypothetical protein AAF288_12585 [Planctomycetota bacterium]